MFSLIHALLCLLLLNCIVDVFAVLKVMLGWNCYPSTKETHNLIQSHFLYDVYLTVWALSAAYIDCHCLTCSLSFSLSLFVFLSVALSCTLLSFVMELLKNSVAMQEQVLACKGFLVIGYTLEKVSKLA